MVYKNENKFQKILVQISLHTMSWPHSSEYQQKLSYKMDLFRNH